jgi:DNA primase
LHRIKGGASVPVYGALMNCYYPSDLLRTLRNQIPIGNLIANGLKMEVYRRGSHLRFRCPCCGCLHTATNPKTNLARCFECRKNFNPIDMVMAAGQCSFVEAVEYLKRRYLGQQL